MRKCPKCGQVYDDSWKVCLDCSVLLSDDTSIIESNPELRIRPEDKRPIGVTILGVLIIAGSILSLLSAQEAWDYNPSISNYLYLLVIPLSIFAALSLLKLKNWARLTVIFISVIVSAETFITTPYAFKKYKDYDMSGFEKSFYKSIESAKQNRKPGAAELTDRQVEELKQKTMSFVKKGMQITLLAAVNLSLIFNCIVIYYFTRAKVREKFT